MTSWTRAAIAVSATAAVGALALLAASAMAGGRPATCVETGCFCEAVSGGIPAQVEASWSSLAFVLLGVWVILWRGVPGTRERRLLPIGGALMISIDIFSMYLLGLLIALGALWRAGRLGGRASIVLLPGVALELTPFIAGRAPGSRRWVVASLATFIGAYAIWILDQSPLCDPHFWLQGHAVWHVLGAVAALLLTVHWRVTSMPTDSTSPRTVSSE